MAHGVAALVRSESRDVEERLRSLGLTLEGIRRSIDLAINDRLACTENDPPSFAGQTRSARTVRYLREEFVNAGWRRNDAGNYSRLMNANATIAVAVATGDVNTGDPRYPTPRLSHKKGEMTLTAVHRNDEQLSLLPAIGDVIEGTRGPLTWILLLNERNNAAFAELSLPRRISNGNVSEWEERVILPPRPLGVAADIEAPEPAPVGDIPVDRR